MGEAGWAMTAEGWAVGAVVGEGMGVGGGGHLVRYTLFEESMCVGRGYGGYELGRGLME